MIGALATSLIVASLLLAAWTVVLVLRNRGVDNMLLFGLGAVELAMLAQTVLGIVNLAGTDRPVSGVTFVAYLVGSLLLLPVAGFWALAERSRWGTGVLVIALLVIPVMVVRMNQIWAGHA